MRRARLARLPLACAVAFAAVPAVAQTLPKGATVPYVTQRGDTLYTVSDRYLQSPADWTRVARLNTVHTPKALQPGTVLKLPVTRLRKEPLRAHVIAEHGPVERAARGSAAFTALPADIDLAEGDKVRTGDGGFVTLELADGTHMSLPPNSQIDLSTLRRTVLTGTLDREIDLRRGAVDSDVTHMKQQDDRFQVRSPSVVAGVRGTSFRVGYDAGSQPATRVEVLDGTVGVNAQRTAVAGATLVHANFGSVTEGSGEVGAPVELLAAPALVKPAKVQDEPQVAFDLVPLDGARSYHVALAHDAGFVDAFAEQRVAEPRAVFQGIADGTYFVRIAAIDAHGLEGQPRTYAFERRQVGLATSAGPGADGYQFRWSSSGAAGKTTYRFVLSASKDLSHPLVDQADIERGQITIADLPPGDYYWSVIAEQYAGGRFYEKASPVSAFTLAR